MNFSLNLNPPAVTRSIRRLHFINGKHKTFVPVSSTYVPGHDKHEEDSKITQLITLINKLYALTDAEKIEFEKEPSKFVNTPSIIGIRHNKNTPYRIVRFERYKDYTTFRAQMNKIGFRFCILKSIKLDGMFIKDSNVEEHTSW